MRRVDAIDRLSRDNYPRHRPKKMNMKRIFDLTLSLVAIFVFSIPFFVLVLIARFKLGSPTFFRQKRAGRNGKLFDLIKLRTMVDLRDSDGQFLPDSERVTPFGHFLRRWSLDEWPELWNVIKGDMSLVGPRPLLPRYLGRYSPRQMRRHEVRPGITGWAQVRGRNAVSWEDRFEFDVWYVENRNLWLDIKILLMTIFAVLNRKGVSAQGHVTMPEFMGK